MNIRLNNCPVFRNYRDIDFPLRFIGRSGNKVQRSMNRNSMLPFVKLKQNIFKRHFSPYWPNTGGGDIEKCAIFNLLASAWDPKPF